MLKKICKRKIQCHRILLYFPQYCKYAVCADFCDCTYIEQVSEIGSTLSRKMLRLILNVEQAQEWEVGRLEEKMIVDGTQLSWMVHVFRGSGRSRPVQVLDRPRSHVRFQSECSTINEHFLQLPCFEAQVKFPCSDKLFKYEYIIVLKCKSAYV